MARCIAFDKATAQAVSRNLHLLTICDPEADPVQSALHSNSPTSLLAAPAEDGKRVLVARFQRRRSLLTPAGSNEPVAFETSGFLGLGDQPVYIPEAQAARKWWQKILE
jgi:hypothetical protein